MIVDRLDCGLGPVAEPNTVIEWDHLPFAVNNLCKRAVWWGNWFAFVSSPLHINLRGASQLCMKKVHTREMIVHGWSCVLVIFCWVCLNFAFLLFFVFEPWWLPLRVCCSKSNSFRCFTLRCRGFQLNIVKRRLSRSLEAVLVDCVWRLPTFFYLQYY